MMGFMRRPLVALALLPALFAPATAAVRRLTILHTNDLHARLSPLDNGKGGFARLATVIRREKTGCVECVLLNAGDLSQGSPVSTVFLGLPVWQIANLFGYRAGTLGNHDFDYGWEQARKFTQVARYPNVLANVIDGEGHLFTKKPFVVLKVNGLKVAVIGAMTDEFTKSLSTPKTRGPWRTSPVLETARKYAAQAAPKADLVVLLAHVTEREEKEFLHQAPEIAVIVSGHAHNGIKEPFTEDGRVVVRTRAYGEELGRLELQVDTERKAAASFIWKRIPVDDTVAPAPDVAKKVKHWEDEVAKKVDQPLAMSEKAFTKAEVKALMERAMREATGADFAFMNMGGIRDIIPQGQLLDRHVWNLMPFDNLVVTGKFKGSQLPPVILKTHKVDPDREYTLAVSDFTAENQSAPSQLRTTGLEFPNQNGLLRDILIQWIRKQKVLR